MCCWQVNEHLFAPPRTPTQYNLRGCATQCGGCGFSKCNLHKDGAESDHFAPRIVQAYTDHAQNDSRRARLYFNLSLGPPAPLFSKYTRACPHGAAAPCIYMSSRVNALRIRRYGAPRQIGLNVSVSFDPEGVLNNIMVGRAFTVDSLIALL